MPRHATPRRVGDSITLAITVPYGTPLIFGFDWKSMSQPYSWASPNRPGNFGTSASYRDLWTLDFGTPTDSREESRADLLGAPNLSSRALRGAPNRRSGALRAAPNRSSPRSSKSEVWASSRSSTWRPSPTRARPSPRSSSAQIWLTPAEPSSAQTSPIPKKLEKHRAAWNC